jgi:hypothetical protein
MSRSLFFEPGPLIGAQPRSDAGTGLSPAKPDPQGLVVDGQFLRNGLDRLGSDGVSSGIHVQGCPDLVPVGTDPIEWTFAKMDQFGVAIGMA